MSEEIRGQALLFDALMTKGTAFTRAERVESRSAWPAPDRRENP